MVKWEYINEYRRDNYGDRVELAPYEMDELGERGWELVGVTSTLQYIFKRPKQNPEGESRG